MLRCDRECIFFLSKESLKSKEVVAKFFKEIKEIRKIVEGTPLAKAKRVKFEFPPINADTIDMELWFVEKGRNMMDMTVRFKHDLMAGVVMADTVGETLAFLYKLARMWNPSYREALKEAGLTSALRPRTTPKRPADLGGRVQEPEEVSRKRARTTAVPNDMQVVMQELSKDDDFKNYFLKLFKKDGLPQFLHKAAEEPMTDLDPVYLEAIKQQGHDLGKTSKSIVQTFKLICR